MHTSKKLVGVGLIFGAAALGSVPSAEALTTVHNGTVSTFTGPAGLDLSGNFRYAINFSNNDPNRTVSGLTFLHDRQVIPGATLTGPNEVTPWAVTPEFGATADDNELEQIMADIRWANSGANQILRADLAVDAGSTYKLQVLWDGNQNENRRWDILFDGALAANDLSVDAVTSNGLLLAGDIAPPGNANASVVWTYTFRAESSLVSVIFDGRGGAGTGLPNGGGDANPIWQALTLEQIQIPEPASATLVGLAGLGLLRRRSRTTA